MCALRKAKTLSSSWDVIDGELFNLRIQCIVGVLSHNSSMSMLVISVVHSRTRQWRTSPAHSKSDIELAPFGVVGVMSCLRMAAGPSYRQNAWWRVCALPNQSAPYSNPCCVMGAAEVWHFGDYVFSKV